MRSLFIFLFVLVAFQSYSQAPVVTNVEPLVTFPNDTIVITGTGFSATKTNLQVWFGAVKGEIIESTELSIRVVVPASASTANIEVINLATKTSARSLDKFMPAYSGTGFSLANFSAPLSFNHDNENLFDLCSCDLNNDGKADIVATKYESGPNLQLFINNSTMGTLAFTEQALNFAANTPTENVQCGDLDGDGKPEIVATKSGNARNFLYVFRNTTTLPTNVTFAAPVVLTLNSLGLATESATRLALFDLNKDGKSEIVVTNIADAVNIGSETGTNGNLYIYINKTSGGVLNFNDTDRVRILIPSIRTYEPVVQDFDGDGYPDVLFGRYSSNEIYFLKNTGSSTVSFATPVKITVSAALGINRIASYDFNNDGLEDILLTSTNNKMLLMMNQSTPTTFAFSAATEFATASGPFGIDINDIDGDKDADAAVADQNVSTLDLFLSNGAATPSFTNSTYTPTWRPRNVKIQDFDGDGKPDIAHTSYQSSPLKSSLSILRNKNCHQPVILNQGPLSVCNGQKIMLETIPANNVTFTWKENGVTVGTNSPKLQVSGVGGNVAKIYTVTATNVADNCAIVSTDFTVTHTNGNPSGLADPTIIENAPVCAGQALNLSSSVAGADQYVWTGPNGFTASTQNPSISNVDATRAGEYSLYIVEAGCRSNTATATIEVVDLANFSIASSNATNTVCQSTAVKLSVNNIVNYSYAWYKNNVALGQTNYFYDVTPGASGSYHVVVSHNTYGCSTPVQAVTLTYVANPVAAFNVSDGCVGQNLTFNNTSTIAGSMTPVYAWTFGDGQSSSATSPTHAYATATGSPFTAKLVASYQQVSGCSSEATDVVNISASTVPVITASAESACPDGDVTLSVPAGFTSVTWSTTETSNTISVGPGTYTVNTVDASGCPGEAQKIIAAFTAPTITITADKTNIGTGSSAQLTASPGDLASYLWAPAETLSSTTISNPIATPVVTTTYTVQGTDVNGCVGQATIVITVSVGAGFPAAFSPNGDGENEFWNIKAETIPDCTVSIFDGRGRRVFEKKGENWDGTYNGTPVPDGTYYYVLGCPSQKPVTGTVLVFR
jgi:gliding motility-associated-like protein